jgi:hypothetical protein
VLQRIAVGQALTRKHEALYLLCGRRRRASADVRIDAKEPAVGDPLAADRRYKVIVWATGTIGRFAIRTILDRPNLELTGVWVHSRSKDGQDVGTLAGLDAVGIRATRDANALLSSDADCVMYVGPGTSRPKEARDDFCRILRAGKNLVTTSIPGLVYERGSLSPRYTGPLREAALAGGSSLFSSGIEPGFGCDLLPIALTSMSHSVYSIRGLEITNYSEYPVAFDVRDMFGFGMPLDYRGGLRTPGALTIGWGAAVTMVADAMGVTLDKIAESCEFQPAPRRIQAASGVVEQGTVGAVWTRCVGVVDGREAITIEHIDRMADDFAPDWPKGRDGGTDGIWRTIIDGEPSFDAEFQVGYRHEENTNDHGLLATGMRALNAIPWVCEAQPGIVDALHLPLTPAVGALRPNRDGIPAF